MDALKTARELLALEEKKQLLKQELQKPLNTLAKEIHENAIKHGWWETKRSLPEILCLCHSELSEALEEARKGHHEKHVYYKGKKPEGVPVEMIDCTIRILDYLASLEIDIDELLKNKHEYNKTREYKHGGKTL